MSFVALLVNAFSAFKEHFDTCALTVQCEPFRARSGTENLIGERGDIFLGRMGWEVGGEVAEGLLLRSDT